MNYKLVYLFTQSYLSEQWNDSVLKSYLIWFWELSLMGQLLRHKLVSNQWSIPPFFILWLIEYLSLVANGQPCLFILDDYRRKHRALSMLPIGGTCLELPWNDKFLIWCQWWLLVYPCCLTTGKLFWILNAVLPAVHTWVGRWPRKIMIGKYLFTDNISTWFPRMIWNSVSLFRIISANVRWMWK